MPHQWLEGNLPVSAKCTVCDKTCGSVLRLQDWRCLWCKAMVSACGPRARSHTRPDGVGSSAGPGVPTPMVAGTVAGDAVTLVMRGFLFQVHTSCKESLQTKCPLGLCKVSVIPPTALNSIDSDGGCLTLSWLTCFLGLLSPCPLPSAMPALVTLVMWGCGREEVRPGRCGEKIRAEVVNGVLMAAGHTRTGAGALVLSHVLAYPAAEVVSVLFCTCSLSRWEMMMYASRCW